LQTDVPDLVLARDAIGTLHLCSLVSRTDSEDLFLAVPLTPSPLTAFEAGEIDLRSVLVESESALHFRGTFELRDGQPSISLEQINTVPDDWLPDRDFLLPDFERVK
jgi:hypothetical protein